MFAVIFAEHLRRESRVAERGGQSWNRWGELGFKISYSGVVIGDDAVPAMYNNNNNS
jgi:hypothetical protein